MMSVMISTLKAQHATIVSLAFISATRYAFMRNSTILSEMIPDGLTMSRRSAVALTDTSITEKSNLTKSSSSLLEKMDNSTTSASDALTAHSVLGVALGDESRPP